MRIKARRHITYLSGPSRPSARVIFSPIFLGIILELRTTLETAVGATVTARETLNICFRPQFGHLLAQFTLPEIADPRADVCADHRRHLRCLCVVRDHVLQEAHVIGGEAGVGDLAGGDGVHGPAQLPGRRTASVVSRFKGFTK